MDFKKFLEMISEAESTSEKDTKAEKAGKEVAKDIEHDEGHKGKDDEKAEKAGEKVTKDIEYDDKKDKKKSLKDWFEIIDKNMLAEAEQVTMEPAKQNTQVIKQGTKTLGTVSNPALAAQIKQSIGKGEMSLAGHEIKEDDVEESGLQAYLGKKKYGKEGMAALQKAGRLGASKEKMAQIRAKHDKLDELSPATMSSAAAKARGQGTAISARSGIDPMISKGPDKDPQSQKDFAKGQKRFAQADKFEKGAGLKSGQAGSHMYDLSTGKYSDRGPESLDEKAKNPYAIGMAQAMKSAGDKPPLKKSTITKAHDIAKAIKKKTDEAQIPNSGPDYGAGLGAGRSQETFEGKKPDFLDLDKDGNKKESMKKAAADKKKQKVKESMNTLEAAYHEGKSHGLSKHGYACRYNEGSEEHKRYHDGFKEGLDECYGLMPNRGLVGETMPAATVPGMASQAMPAMEADMEEGNLFTGNLAKARAAGKTMADLDGDGDMEKVTEFAFEDLDKQLNDLLNEGLSVNMSQGLNDGMGGQGTDTVSVTATDDDAAKLLDFIKQVGLGGLGGDKVEPNHGEVVAQVSDYGAPKFSGHDDMMGLMKVVSGDDYKDEESHEKDHGEPKLCGTHGVVEEKCGCGESKEMVDEVESEDQMEYQVAEDDGEGYEQSQAAAAEIDSALAGAMGGDDVKVDEGGDGGEASEEPEMTEGAEDNPVTPEEELTEWANDAGKDGTDQTFERDIEFMTKVIAGGLNKPKVDQTTLPHTSVKVVGEDADVLEWKRLAGL